MASESQPKPPRPRRSRAFWVTMAALAAVVLAVSEVAADWAPDLPRLTSGVVKSTSDCGLMAEVLKNAYNLDQVFVVSGQPNVKLACDWKALHLDVTPPPKVMDAESSVVAVSPPRYSFWRMRAHVRVSLTVDKVGGGQVCAFQRTLTGWKAAGCGGSFTTSTGA
jgi:hypothetical protein